ncbi:MAG TPA: DUF4388 domain-containing protein [Thermodesulfovibrionales bacterium]|nr:DUF4388 domain-containing protein [Thermodesulfovibrionales bacterium]
MSLAGRLEDLSLSDIFQILSIGKKTGTFVVKGTKGAALIVFKNGVIVRAETDDLEGTVGDTMLKAGMIKESVLHMAQEVKKKLPAQSIAAILFDLGAVSRDALDQVTRKRIEHVIYRLLLWEDGDFQFEPDDLEIEGKLDLSDSGWELAKGLSPEYLLMEGARVQDESSQVSFVPTEAFSVEGAGEREEAESETGWDDDWGGAPAVERKDILALKSLTQELRFPNSTSEITLLVLRFASDIFQRGVLFMAGKDHIIGLGQFGIEVERADEKIRGIVLSLDASPFLRKIVGEQIAYKGELEKDAVTQYFMEEIGDAWPPEAVFLPVVAEGKVVAVLYCDNALSRDPIGETEGLEIFVSHAGLALEKSLLQRRLQEMEKDRG